jgi:chorismate synthase
VALTYRTAGESHGPALFAVVEGLPAGLGLTPDDIDTDLARRQLGYAVAG